MLATLFQHTLLFCHTTAICVSLCGKRRGPFALSIWLIFSVLSSHSKSAGGGPLRQKNILFLGLSVDDQLDRRAIDVKKLSNIRAAAAAAQKLSALLVVGKV